MITLTHQEHPELSPERLCALLGVSKSWYYEQRKQAEYDPEDIALRDHIEDIILEFPGYGYRRVTHALARSGGIVNHKRVLRIMREESLLCHLKKRFVVITTNSRHGFPVIPTFWQTQPFLPLIKPGWRTLPPFGYEVPLCIWPASWMPSLLVALAGISLAK